jgi:peptide chain release factor subunit 1
MITLRQVEDLMKISSDKYPIISFYMGIPPVLLIQKKYLVLAKDIAKEGTRSLSRFSDEQKEIIKKDTDKILNFVHYDFEPKAGGIAIFSCSPLKLWQVYLLPQRIKGRLVVDYDPYTRPLVRFFDENEKYFIAIVDRKKARLFSMYTGILNERKEVFDEVQGRHKKGGWSQSRFQRHVDNQATKHLQNVAGALYEVYKLEKFDHLMLGGPLEARVTFKNIIHSSLQRIIVSELDVGLDESSSVIQDAIHENVISFEQKQSKEYLRTLFERLGKNHLAVSGLKDTVKMLHEARIHTLMIREDLVVPGFKCTACETPFIEHIEKCALCGKKASEVPDIIDEIVEKTYELHGEVKFIKESKELDKLGGIAALLRW